MYNPTITLENMNAEAFKMLAQQKLELQNLISKGAPDILEGVVNMIDHIQDQCVDKNDIPENIVFPLNIYARGTPVLSSDGKIKGKLTGGSRSCGMEGCTGRTLGVRWEDGKLTFPCSKGMNFEDGTWKIIN